MKGFTVWFTGLPCSGKSTLALRLREVLNERGITKVEILDGDVVRTNLSKGLGFSKEDRDINIRRIGFVCGLLSRNEAVAIAAAISPYSAIRAEVRAMIDNFVEVYVKAPIEVLAERDVKGMWKKALAGEIKNFTGVDDPYEAPEKPEVIVETDNETIDESVGKIIKTLEALEYIPPAEDDSYSAEEEEKIKERLKSLGYI
ncbi:MAG TPA: adenylyl-sulfate kinase [Acidobacteriota bacterium]|nr:adenylyl-sulfate kinase [Acidobacteriota bacterium]